MKALTIRNIPQDIAHAVKERALQQHMSLNKAILSLLAEMTGVSRTKKALHHDLDHLFGLWRPRQNTGLEKTLTRQRTIDRDLWK